MDHDDTTMLKLAQDILGQLETEMGRPFDLIEINTLKGGSQLSQSIFRGSRRLMQNAETLRKLFS